MWKPLFYSGLSFGRPINAWVAATEGDRPGTVSSIYTTPYGTHEAAVALCRRLNGEKG